MIVKSSPAAVEYELTAVADDWARAIVSNDAARITGVRGSTPTSG